MIKDAEFSVARVTRFYVPLLFQAFSQSLTYPLVAGIVTHGNLGVHALTAFSQGQMIMFMIGALGGGLITTGLVFARTRKGYAEFCRLNNWMMGALLLLQCVPALPYLSDWLFGGLFALPAELADIARRTLFAGVVMNGAFFLRNIPLVILFSNLESGKANLATCVRILVTLVCSLVFPRVGWTGPDWGLTALTLGVVVELVLTWHFARPYVRALPGDVGGEHVSLLEQLRFTLPLSFGGFLLMVSPLLVATFVGRSACAADMLAIHYVTLGVANPVAYGALRMHAVAIKFPPTDRRDRRLVRYAVVAGALLGLVPFAFSLPPLGDWYFGVYQNVPERLLATTRLAIGLYSGICMIHAVRGCFEGLAARNRRPRLVMAGQVAYTLTIFVSLATLLLCGVPGWLMAVSAITLAPAAALVVLRLGLRKTADAERDVRTRPTHRAKIFGSRSLTLRGAE